MTYKAVNVHNITKAAFIAISLMLALYVTAKYANTVRDSSVSEEHLNTTISSTDIPQPPVSLTASLIDTPGAVPGEMIYPSNFSIDLIDTIVIDPQDRSKIRCVLKDGDSFVVLSNYNVPIRVNRCGDTYPGRFNSFARVLIARDNSKFATWSGFQGSMDVGLFLIYDFKTRSYTEIKKHDCVPMVWNNASTKILCTIRDIVSSGYRDDVYIFDYNAKKLIGPITDNANYHSSIDDKYGIESLAWSHDNQYIEINLDEYGLNGPTGLTQHWHCFIATKRMVWVS